jgi:hypothetical protein
LNIGVVNANGRLLCKLGVDVDPIRVITRRTTNVTLIAWRSRYFQPPHSGYHLMQELATTVMMLSQGVPVGNFRKFQ